MTTIIVESGTHNVTFFSLLNITPNAKVGVMPGATMILLGDLNCRIVVINGGTVTAMGGGASNNDRSGGGMVGVPIVKAPTYPATAAL